MNVLLFSQHCQNLEGPW